MSSSSPNTEDDDFDIEEYRTNEGLESKTQNVSSDEHVLKQELGESDDAKERNLDVSIGAERFVDLYESPDAAIREMLANSESACLDRARIELRELGVDIPSDTSKLLQKAKELAGYEPQIDITYREKPEATTFTLSDNGCGISTNRYKVIQNIGYSTSKDEDSNVGMFGVGWYSTFTLCGKNDHFQMVTRSRKTEESYGTMEYLANVEYLDKTRQNYGTTFDVPAFCHAAKDIDVASAVERYSEGLRVTVVYRHFDDSGEETDASEEYQATALEDRYDDDELKVVYEDEFFKAVMAPASMNRYKTFNISMPIQRNAGRSHRSSPKMGAKWKHDVRVKREDGAICEHESDKVIGRVPIEDSKFDKKQASALDDFVGVQMVTASKGDIVNGGPYDGKKVIGREEFRVMKSEVREEYIPLSRVPDEAVSMPKPSSSRDGYEKGNDDFWQHVASKLMDEWKEIASDRFEELDDWQTFLDMDSEEQEALVRAYNQFGPSYGTNEPSNIQDELEDTFGVTIPEETCVKLDNLNKSYKLVKEGCDNPHYKSNASKTNVRKLLRNYDRVFMAGPSVNEKKCNLVWGMPEDTAVVRLEGTGYSQHEGLWGWEKLKDVPSRNIKEKLPSVDDDVLDEWEDKSASANRSSSSSGNRRTSRDPTTKKVKVRTGTKSPRYMTDHNAENLKNKLNNGDSFKCGRGYSRSAKWLIVKDQTEINGSVPPTRDCSKYKGGGIATTAVPKYVYKYLIDADRAFGSYAQVRRAIENKELDELDTNENIIFADGHYLSKYFDGDEDEFLKAVRDYTDHDLRPAETDIHTSIDTDFIQAGDFDADTYSYHSSTSLASDTINLPEDVIVAEQHLPDCLDRDDIESDEFYGFFGTDIKSLDFDSESFKLRKKAVEEMDGLPGR